MEKEIRKLKENYPYVITKFKEESGNCIKEISIEESIAPKILDSIAEPAIVKFVDDFRRLKQGVSKGAVKRKSTPTKKAPLRKAKTISKQKQDAAEQKRKRALSGNASAEEQQDFLRTLAERSLNM